MAPVRRRTTRITSVARDDVEDARWALVGVHHPHAERARAAEDGLCRVVDRPLDILQRRVHHGARRGHLDVDLEEGRVDEEEGGQRARCDARLERVERLARAVEHRAVGRARKVLRERGDVRLVDLLRDKVEVVREDLRDEVVHRELDLDVLLLHDQRLVGENFSASRRTCRARAPCLLGHLDERQQADDRLVALEAVGDDVLELLDELVEAHHLDVEALQVAGCSSTSTSA